MVETAAAQTPAVPPQTGLDRLDALNLRQIAGELITLDYSDRAAEISGAYQPEIAAAAHWFARNAGWVPSLNPRYRVAVLAAEDYPRIGDIPYPTPYTETRTGMIVIADDVSSHPAFELWDIDPFELNIAWAFHEMGHKIARDLGIWSPSFFVNELIANVFMAGYIRAERPMFLAYQSGLPPRFAGEGVLTKLEDFDRVYFQMGQANYLWFHFQLAAMADFMVTDEDFGALIDKLAEEFNFAHQRVETVEQSLARLERIKPGITALAAPMR